MDHFGHGSSARDEAIGRIVATLPLFCDASLEAIASWLEEEVQGGGPCSQSPSYLRLHEDPELADQAPVNRTF